MKRFELLCSDEDARQLDSVLQSRAEVYGPQASGQHVLCVSTTVDLQQRHKENIWAACHKKLENLQHFKIGALEDVQQNLDDLNQIPRSGHFKNKFSLHYVWEFSILVSERFPSTISSIIQFPTWFSTTYAMENCVCFQQRDDFRNVLCWYIASSALHH